MLDKEVIDNISKDKKELFDYPLDENQKSDNLVMISSNLVKEYEKGSDGYALLVEKRPSLTPLDVNMSCVDFKD